jgi:oligo-alginate lyase
MVFSIAYMKKIIVLFVFSCSYLVHAQQHPIAFATAKEFAAIKQALQTDKGLLQQSFQQIKKETDAYIGKVIDVPKPKDAAGGYTHERHKANYNLMFNAGILYNITGNAAYAEIVKKLLLQYAQLNPTLKNHPEATSSSPGRIFWQALNDANWLVYTGLSFDLVYNYLTPTQRKSIADNAFAPIVNYVTVDIKDWFNLIHNHAVWATAGVGIVGVATDNEHYVQQALQGADKNGKAGFLALIDGLFSPDGFYTEGPYYTRYAVLPFYMFANALQQTKPALKIFNYRNSVLEKALLTALQQTNINGGFYSYNDALKEKTYVSGELVTALAMAWKYYGANTDLLVVAKQQNKVLLHTGGAGISKALATNKNIPAYLNYTTLELTDGADGKSGGVTVLRNGKNEKLTSLIVKYTGHGLSHGHYDKLNINLYDAGNEILQDYGAARFIGIEQKYGGRYLPETKGFAMQTIAHNTVVVDEQSHFGGKEEVAENYHGNKIFSNLQSTACKVVATNTSDAYKGVYMQRHIYQLLLPNAEKPLYIDIFKNIAATPHQYDLPFYYVGNLISFNQPYTAYTTNQNTLGAKNGYQYLWKEAEIKKLKNPFTQLTFLNGKTFYSISSLQQDSAQVIFARIGGNDPNYNLRREPACILRSKGSNITFINAIEIHGQFNGTTEVSSNTYSQLSSIEKLQDDENYTVVKIFYQQQPIILIQVNNLQALQQHHSITIQGLKYEFTGAYAVYLNHKKL